jgi:hypothetical protein
MRWDMKTKARHLLFATRDFACRLPSTTGGRDGECGAVVAKVSCDLPCLGVTLAIFCVYFTNLNYNFPLEKMM